MLNKNNTFKLGACPELCAYLCHISLSNSNSIKLSWRITSATFDSNSASKRSITVAAVA